ncbi:MAG: peptide deformylase [Lachnospiraceae bacterium]|nr:peptide deformylase [Lachnospiraceae bacterium]
MAIRKIRIEGDPILNKISKEVTSMTHRNQELIEDMIDTMYDAYGVGLAAPQVGVLKRIVVIDVSEEGNDPMVLINPRIIEMDGEQTGSEGCLSVPGKHGIVTRAEHVICRALDENMQERDIEGTGLLARAIQHELDHLEGVIYTSKVEGEIMDNAPEEEGE